MKAAARTFFAIAVATLAAWLASSYWTSAALIVRASGIEGPVGILARWDATSVADSLETLDIRDGSLRVRVFRPAGPPRRSALLVSGVHPDGINEERLVALARNLAATGVVVVTPEIEDLIHYRLTARVTDTIEEAAVSMVARPDLFGPRPIGLIGVSFSGGLSIVAAGRPALRGRVAYVLSFGGHGNLPRVLKYLCTGVAPPLSRRAEQTRPPHDYAVTIVIHQAADLIVPPEDVAQLREAIEIFLRASSLSRSAPDQAASLFAEARLREAALPEPASAVLRRVNERDVAALGRLLEPYVDRLGQDASLSPELSSVPSAPVYLLHGLEDNIIPAAESELLARHLRGHTRVQVLLSGYLTHVDLTERPTATDTWNMIAFWKSVLDEY